MAMSGGQDGRQLTRASGEYTRGRYVVRTFATGGKVRARAFLGTTVVADAEGPSLDEARRAMAACLDARDARQRGTCRDDFPSEDRFADAFARLDHRIGPHHWLMLKALLAAPDHTLTATEIAAAAGYPSFSSANAHLGAIARMIAEDLDYTPPTRADGSPIWTWTLADHGGALAPEEDGQWRWKLRPQVVACLHALNIGTGR